MSVQSEINRISTAVDSLKTSIANKGVSVSSSAKVGDLSSLVDSIGVTFYTGTSEPSSSLGNDGDIYFVTEG